MQFIVGNDISQFQGNIDWPVYKDNTNFVAIKASEGVHYIDGWFGNNRHQARIYNLPRIFYHVIRPDLGNTPEMEAQWLLDLLNGDPLEEGELIALDMENPFAGAVEWCRSWLDYIFQKTGIKPLIYLNQSLVKQYDWSPVVNAGYPLWLASYQEDGVGATGIWDRMTIQQTTSSQQVPGIVGNVDRDIFFGTKEELLALGFKSKSSTPANETPASTPAEGVSTPSQEALQQDPNASSPSNQANQGVVDEQKKTNQLLSEIRNLIQKIIEFFTKIFKI